MTGFYLYLLKAILSLGLVYGIYILCLRKLTFFQRFLLIAPAFALLTLLFRSPTINASTHWFFTAFSSLRKKSFT